MPPSNPPSSMSMPKMEIAPRRQPRVRRDKLAANLKMAVWVVLLTIGIWIWAEREQVLVPNTPNVLGIPVLIRSDNLYVEPSSSGPQIVNLKISGPQEQIDHVRQALNEKIPKEIEINIGNAPVADRQAVHIVDQIQNMELFKRAGVTVEESQPADLFVNVDRYRTRQVDLTVSSDVAALLAGPATFTPPRVTVSGPEKAITDSLKVEPDFSSVAAELTHPGEHTFNLPLKKIVAGEKLRVSPTTVSVTLTVKSADENYTIRDGIPITVDAPVALTDAYKVIIGNDATIADITVVGPKAAVDSIRDKKAFVKATLEVTNDDIGKQDLSRELKYKLPDGVTVTDESKRRTVDFKVVSRGG